MPPTIIPIDDLDDPHVDVFRDVRDRDLRGRDGLFMAESELVVRRMLREPKRVHSLLLSPGKLKRLRDVLAALPEDVPVYLADVDLMSAIAGFHVHRGALAAGIRPSPEQLVTEVVFRHLECAARCTLILAEGLTNVDNMGGLFRNAAAFGADGVLLDPACCDPLYRKAIRVSMGHVLSVPYAISEDWAADLKRLRDWGMTLIAAESTADALPLWDVPQREKIAVVFGSEGAGLDPQTLRMCDLCCTIPMAGDVPSINVAVASAVFLYERHRGRVRE